MDEQAFFRAVVGQDETALRAFFHPAARIFWPCTNERFSVEEYLRANCEYPGRWDGELERVEWAGDVTILAGRIFGGERVSAHVVSFLKIADGRIAEMTEYFGGDGPAPEWRREMRIGTKIRE